MKLWYLLLTALALFASEEEASRRIAAHLTLGDFVEAAREAERASSTYPDSEHISLLYAEALARGGRTDDALGAWERHRHDHLLESICWGVLEQADSAPHLFGRLFAMMGAAQTGDVRATPLILSQLRSQDAFLRRIAVDLTASFRDERLIQELQEMFDRERVWHVRLSLIEACGRLALPQFQPYLESIVRNGGAPLEERAVAARALAELADKAIDPTPLFSSNRAGLRYLACEIVSHLELDGHLEALRALLADPIPHVQVAALRAIAHTGAASEVDAELRHLSKTAYLDVALTAAAIVMQTDERAGAEVLKTHLFSDHPKARRLAAGAAICCGKAALPLVRDGLQKSDDPYVIATLAYGSIGMGESARLACERLSAFLASQSGRLMIEESLNPAFIAIAPTSRRPTPPMPHYPDYVDQHIRLKIVALLATCRYPHAEKELRSLLSHPIDGLTYVAATTLLEEGGEEALDLIEGLLDDPNPKVRLQAAVVLALAGVPGTSTEVLRSLYDTVDREGKMTVIGALGHIGEREALPFFIQRLEEPFSLIRVVAAASLLTVLHH
jgi:HEAT repeat protein